MGEIYAMEKTGQGWVCHIISQQQCSYAASNNTNRRHMFGHRRASYFEHSSTFQVCGLTFTKKQIVCIFLGKQRNTCGMFPKCCEII